MRRVLALLVIVGTAWAVRSFARDEATPSDTALALGFALVASALAGGLLERVRLPRVTGYLLFGLACGPYVANIISGTMARELQLVNGLAVALIAFIAGLEIDIAALRPKIAAILGFAGAVIAATFALLFVVFWATWSWLPILPEATGLTRAALSALAATLVTSFSPTVTMAVIAESRAEGPYCSLLVPVVVLADLVLILMFTGTMQLVRGALGAQIGGEVGLVPRLLWEIPGSLAFGALLGALFALYVRTVGRELTIVLVALCALLSEVGAGLHFEPVMAALTAGLVVQNVAPPQGHAFKEAVERGALPVLILFFAAAGASLQLDALASLGVLAIGVSTIRAGAIWAGARAGTRLSAVDPRQSNLVWMGLVSQAGVTLGLVFIVAAEFPSWGARLQTLVVALIAFHQLVGPVLLKTALVRAGEVGRIDEVPEARARPATAGSS